MTTVVLARGQGYLFDLRCYHFLGYALDNRSQCQQRGSRSDCNNGYAVSGWKGTRMAQRGAVKSWATSVLYVLGGFYIRVRSQTGFSVSSKELVRLGIFFPTPLPNFCLQ